MVPAKGRSPGDIEQSMTTVGLGKPAMVSKLEHLLESRPRKNHAALNSVSFPLLESQKKQFSGPPSKRGFSSVGRASALQAECQRFESVNLHHLGISNFEFEVSNPSGPVAQLVRAPP